MSLLNCGTLHRLVTVAGAMLVTGILIEVVAYLVSPGSTLVFLQPVALALVLASPVVLALATLGSVLMRGSLKDCIH